MNPQPKLKRIICPVYISWLIEQPCVISGDYSTPYLNVVPAHQTLGYGFMSGKGHDIWALPLRADLHDKEHRGHDTFWLGHDIPLLIIQHLKRYSDETGGAFWNPQDLTKMLVEYVAAEWIMENAK